MHIVVPVLSVIALVFAFAWVWLNGQLHAPIQIGHLSGLIESVPYMMLGMLFLQSGLVYALFRLGRKAMPFKVSSCPSAG
ncbi:MAG: hypothetical protein KJ914_09365 [Gammaproteobacteria bacterium]|nr:hypothetical protein [Gammaproteobacteria bacterium]